MQNKYLLICYVKTCNDFLKESVVIFDINITTVVQRDKLTNYIYLAKNETVLTV